MLFGVCVFVLLQDVHKRAYDLQLRWNYEAYGIVGEVVTTVPTIGFNVETVTYKNLRFQVWDLGGQTSIRPYWRCYYQNTNAVIYVVDSADPDRMAISKQVRPANVCPRHLHPAWLINLASPDRDRPRRNSSRCWRRKS